MSTDLRKRLIRLAYEKPALRAQILPLVSKRAQGLSLGIGGNGGVAYAALTVASSELLDKGMENEAELVTKLKQRLLRTDPSLRTEGLTLAREMYRRYGVPNMPMPGADLTHEVGGATAYAALTVASSELSGLGMESEAELATRVKVRLLRQDPNVRQDGLSLAREMFRRYAPKLASRRKTANRPILERAGLDASAVKDGMGAMLYMIDPAANHSKFYEMLIVPEGRGFKLMRRWGALTDSGNTGRVDAKDEFHETLRNAQASMRQIYVSKTRKGYVDAWKHSGPKGQYPVGLTRDVGFGWGTQSMAFCIPALRTIAENLKGAQHSLDRMQFGDASDTLNQVAELAKRKLMSEDSTMAKKIMDNIAHMQGRATRLMSGEIDRQAIKDWRVALSRLTSYIDKQLAVCH